jgi:hypothetical protein
LKLLREKIVKQQKQENKRIYFVFFTIIMVTFLIVYLFYNTDKEAVKIQEKKNEEVYSYESNKKFKYYIVDSDEWLEKGN